MARFVFELEAVLRQRESEELQAQVRVANIEAERVGLERRIVRAHASAQEEREALRAFIAGDGAVVDVESARRQAAAIRRAGNEAQRAVVQLAGVHKRLEHARAELLACTTRRKAVETLRERRYREYLAEQQRREASALDEINITRGARSNDELEVIG